MHDVPDNPLRVAGPGEHPSDHLRPDPPDPMEAYKNMLEAEDAERVLNEVRPMLAQRSVMDIFNDEFKR